MYQEVLGVGRKGGSFVVVRTMLKVLIVLILNFVVCGRGNRRPTAVTIVVPSISRDR